MTKNSKEAAPTSAPNVYEPRLKANHPKFTKHPSALYFYYITANTNGRVSVRHYYYDQHIKIEGNQFDAIIQHMILNARDNRELPPPHGSYPQRVVYRKIVHLVFVTDTDGLSTKDAGLNFGSGNVSFFDGEALPASTWGSLPNAQRLTGVRCINHMKKDAAGEELTGFQDFRFQLSLTVARLGVRDDFTLDSGGTNMGPPVPPPLTD